MATNLNQEIFQDNPIAYWNLGEATGTSADNLGSLGTAVDGTYSGAPTLGVEGLAAGGETAADFDGVDDGVAIPNHSQINTQNHAQRTVELWFNADTLDGTQVLYEEGGGLNGLNIYIEGDRLNLGAWANNAGEWLDYGINASTNYHVVLAFDHGTLTGYVNNQEIGRVDTGFATMPAHGGAIGIGQMRQYTRFSDASFGSGNGNYFDGTIDDVALYNTALSENRVSAHYTASVAPTPIAQWSLGETSGTVADNSGSIGDAVDGTYSGAPTLGVEGLIEGSDTAADFDGINDGIVIASHNQINLQSHAQRTVELWFNADTLDGQQVLYEEGGTTHGLNIFLEGDRLNLGAWANNAGTWLDYGIDANSTYHVVLVFENGTLTGYVNNQQIGLIDTGFAEIPIHTDAIGLGKTNGATRLSDTSLLPTNSAYFDGTIDEVLLYNGALTADAVSDRYTANVKIHDSIAGDAGDNTLSGGIGNDTIDAGTGNDLIAGNEGNDVLTGGNGDDAFIFDEITGFVDRILDFNPGQDRLVIGPSVGATSVSQFSFTSDPVMGQLSFNGNVFAQLNGVGSLDLTRDLLIQQRLEVDENVAYNAEVGSVAIENPAASGAYQIVSASTNGVFSINDQGKIIAGSGDLRIGTVLNYEQESEYTLQVQVTDDLGQTYTKEVLVGVNNLNEAPDIVENGQQGGLSLDILSAVSENATAGTVVADLSAADEDINDRFLFSIVEGNDTGIFQIDPVLGTVTVADPTQLDYETTTAYSLKVKVTDSSGASDVANLAIQVNDENEAPTIEDQTFYWKNLGVQQAGGAVIGKVLGSDSNNDNLTYKIKQIVNPSPNSFGNYLWSINESTGELYPADIAADSTANADLKKLFSQELYKAHHADKPLEIIVEVSDGDLTDTATVTLKQDKFIGFFEKTGAENPFNGTHNANVSSVEQTKPTFVDLDKDGDLDAVLGLHTSAQGQLRVYENDGTGNLTSNPGLLPLQNTSGSNISHSNVGSFYPSPAFGDVDGDGDLDFVLGNNSKIRYFANNNGIFREQNDANNPFSGIGLEGKQTTAALGDVNGDGRIDLLLGRNNKKNNGGDPGQLYLYKQNNNGSFDSSATSTKTLGTNNNDRRPSPTLVDLNYDGNLDIVLGVENGKIRYYEGDGTANLGNFVQKTNGDNPFKLVDIGDESTPAFGDLNNDGYLDLAVGTGNGDGKVSFFANPPSDGTLNFTLGSQNLWGGSSISKNIDLGGFSKDLTKSTKVGPVKVFGGAAFDFGFDAGFEFDPGNITAALPFNLLVDVPEQVSVGETIDLGATVKLNPEATFNTTSPFVKANLDLDFAFYLGGGIEVDYGVGKAKIDLADFLGTDIDFSMNQTFDSRTLEFGKTFGVTDNPDKVDTNKEKTLAETKASDLEEADYEDFNFADFKFKSPNLDVTGTASSGYSISGSKTSTLVETNLLIDDTLVYLFKKTGNPTLYKIAEYWQDEKKFGSSKVSWNLLDLGLGGEVNLKTDYELTFDDITGTLHVENGSGAYTEHANGSFDELTGQFANVPVGNDGNGNGKLDYYIDFDLVNPQLKTKMDILVGDITLDLGLLEGRADINAGFFKEKVNFSAFEETFKLGSVNQGFTVLNETMNLDEFAASRYTGAIDLVG